jgi:hypothetical protein
VVCIGARCRPTIIGRREWQPSLRCNIDAYILRTTAQHTRIKPLSLPRDELRIDYSIPFYIVLSFVSRDALTVLFGRPRFVQGLSFRVIQKEIKVKRSGL